MEKKNNCMKVGFSRILWSVMAILLCAVPCAAVVEVPAGEEWDIPGDAGPTINDTVWVYGTANILAGAHITQELGAFPCSTLNIYGGQVDWCIVTYISGVPTENPNVTVYGTEFEVDGVQYETPASVIIPYGTLTGKYEDRSDINLVFMSDIPIHLAAPPASGPTPIYIDIKPGSYPNSINLGSNGVIPVAILSEVGFDATMVPPENVFLAGSGVRVRGKGNKYLASEEDVNGDGLTDLVVKVETVNLDPGTFQDGVAFLRVHETSDQSSPVLYEGWDEIRIVPPE